MKYPRRFNDDWFSSHRSTLLWVIITTGVLEMITIVMRFGFRWESTRDTASTIGQLTMGLRIHHGYLGVLTLALSYALSDTNPQASRNMLILGAALVLSDLIHHFLVLWPITGSPQFDLFYPLALIAE